MPVAIEAAAATAQIEAINLLLVLPALTLSFVFTVLFVFVVFFILIISFFCSGFFGVLFPCCDYIIPPYCDKNNRRFTYRV
jgi:hypothetical protein